jgi:hypothetical protein
MITLVGRSGRRYSVKRNSVTPALRVSLAATNSVAVYVRSTPCMFIRNHTRLSTREFLLLLSCT